MPKQAIAYLKSLFVTGARPAQQAFHDLLDSFVHKDDQGAVSEALINGKILSYDTAQKMQSPDGIVNTLGDVFKVFQSYSDQRNINDELKWSGLPGRPQQLTPIWDEQIIVFNSVTWNTTSSSAVRSIKGIAGVTGNAVVTDIAFLAHQLATSQGGSVTIFSPVTATLGVTLRVPTSA